MKFASDFLISKTNWGVLLVILTAAAGYIEGHIDGQITVGGIFLAMLIAFVRDTVQKNTDAINGLVIEPVTEPDTEEEAP